MNLRAKFLLSFIALIVLSALLIGIISYSMTEKSLIANTVDSSQYISEQIAMNIEASTKELTDYIYTQTERFNIGKQLRTEHEMKALLKKMEVFLSTTCNMKAYMRAVGVLDRSGRSYIYTRDEVSEIDNTFGSFYYSEDGQSINDGMMRPDSAMVEEIISVFGNCRWRQGEDGSIYMYRALVDPDTMQYVGIIIIELSNAFIDELYSNIYKMVGGRIVVMSGDKTILSSYDQFAEQAVMQLISEGTLLDKSDDLKHYYDDREYILAQYITKDAQWRVVDITLTNDIAKQAQKIKNWIIIACLIAAVVAMGVAVILSDNITGNLRELAQHIKRFSKGQFHERIEKIPTDEVGLIAKEFNKMADQIDELINTVYQEQLNTQSAEIKALEFEYSALQSQINPHFMYNTLEGINCLAKIKGENDIAEMIYLLESLMRDSIDIRENTVQVSREIGYIKNYLAIQKYLLGDKFEVCYEIDEALMGAWVPKFILQPIVENAIQHGIEEKIGNGLITIKVMSREDYLIFTVEDSGVGIAPEVLSKVLHAPASPDRSQKRPKVGMNSVDKRIKLLYGAEYGITVTSRLREGTMVTIKMPLLFEYQEKLGEELYGL